MSDGPPDERFLYLSDVLPTAWQGVKYAGAGAGSSVVVLGLETFHTHSLPLEQGPAAYAMFQAKDDGAVKVLLKP